MLFESLSEGESLTGGWKRDQHKGVLHRQEGPFITIRMGVQSVKEKGGESCEKGGEKKFSQIGSPLFLIAFEERRGRKFNWKEGESAIVVGGGRRRFFFEHGED